MNDKQRMKVEKKILKIICVCFALLVVCYTVYEIYDVNRAPVKTRTAYEQTVYDTVDMDIFVIRDEQYIESKASGTTVPLVSDGERVARNADIAAVFSSAQAASGYINLDEMKKELARYDSLSSQATFSGLKVGTLKTQIQSDMCSFLKKLYTGDTEEALNFADDFRDKATTLGIVTGTTIDIAQKRQTLSKKIAAAEASLAGMQTVSTGIDEAGFYMSSSDGYERTVEYASAKKLTPSEVQAAFNTKPAATGGAGKLVKSYRWYAAAVVDAKSVADISVGDTVTLNLPECEQKNVSVKVWAKNEDTKGKAALVFVCSNISEQLLALRIEKAELVMNSYTGFSVESKEIRVIEQGGNKINGVYILRGNIVNFRKVNIIYSGDGYVISGASTGDYIQLYDEIIISGRDLHDGAVIYD